METKSIILAPYNSMLTDTDEEEEEDDEKENIENKKKNNKKINNILNNEAEKQKHLIKYFLEERRVLLELDHPFIMKLIRTFKSKENIFFLTNYINGKGLNKYLESKKEKTFRNKEETRFPLYVILIFLFLRTSHS